MKTKVILMFAALSLMVWSCNEEKKSECKEDVEQKPEVVDTKSDNADTAKVEKVQAVETEKEVVPESSPKEIKQMLQTWFKKDGLFKHAPALAALMNSVDDAAYAQGSEVGYFDYDVWQETQDETGPEIVNDVAMIGKNTAVASVTIDYGFRKSDRTVILSNESGKWEIVDFVTSSGDSFLLTCQAAIKELK